MECKKAEEMDSMISSITSALADIDDPATAFPIESMPKWDGWLKELEGALQKIQQLTVNCRRVARDPNRLEKYRACKWQYVVKEINSNTKKPIPCIWKVIPQEIGRLCVNHMDFETRTMLRRADRTSRTIVDKVKMSLDQVYIQIDDNLSMRLYEGTQQKAISTSTIPLSTVIESITFLLNHLKSPKTLCVAHLDYYSPETNQTVFTNALTQLLPSVVPFKFETVDFAIKNSAEIAMFVLQNSGSELKKIRISNDALHELYSEFIELPAVINTPCIEWAYGVTTASSFHWLSSNDSHFLIDIAQKWIEADVPLGHFARLSGVSEYMPLSRFFPERAVYEGMSRDEEGQPCLHSCIRTNDPNKVIVSRETPWAHSRYIKVMPADHVRLAILD